MFALTDSQLRIVWNAADGLPAEKRGIYLERIVAWLQFRDGRFIDRDLDDAVRLALRGLIQESAAWLLTPLPAAVSLIKEKRLAIWRKDQAPL